MGYYVHWPIGGFRHIQAMAMVDPQFFEHYELPCCVRCWELLFSYHFAVSNVKAWKHNGFAQQIVAQILVIGAWTRTGSYHRYLRMRAMTFAESMGQLPCNGVMSAINLPKSKPMPVRQRAACSMFLGTSLRGILRRMLAGGCMWIHIGTYVHI